MDYETFNRYCRERPASTYVVQWGGCHVWKVANKVFAIGGWEAEEAAFTFKVSEVAYEMLKDRPGLRPAPYFASRGLKWIQHYDAPGLNDGDLREYIARSYELVSGRLSNRKRAEHGLERSVADDLDQRGRPLPRRSGSVE